MNTYRLTFSRWVEQTADIYVDAPDANTAEGYAASELGWAEWEVNEDTAEIPELLGVYLEDENLPYV